MAGEEDVCFVKSMWSEDLIRNLLSLYIQYKDLLEARHSMVALLQQKRKKPRRGWQLLKRSTQAANKLKQLTN